MTDSAAQYGLLESLPDHEVPAGTSLLVVASEPVGEELMLRLLAQGVHDGEDLLVITTDDPAGTITDDIRDVAGTEAVTDHVTLIDCQTGEVTVDDESVVEQNVNTPRNLTDIGIGFKNAFDAFDERGVERVRFGLLSLSIILSYVDRETVYRFCRTLTRGLAQENALGLFFINEGAHDEETIGTLRRAFDGMIRAESAEEGLRLQLSGLDGVPEDWVTL